MSHKKKIGLVSSEKIFPKTPKPVVLLGVSSSQHPLPGSTQRRPVGLPGRASRKLVSPKSWIKISNLGKQKHFLASGFVLLDWTDLKSDTVRHPMLFNIFQPFQQKKRILKRSEKKRNKNKHRKKEQSSKQTNKQIIRKRRATKRSCQVKPTR